MIRILHVDDEKCEHTLLKHNLRKLSSGLELQWAGSGEEALGLLEEETFDCILCDYQMAEMNGLELLTALSSRNNDIPFIFLTGQGSEKLVTEALRAGADDYYTKEKGFAHYERLFNSIAKHVKSSKHKEDQGKAEKALQESEEKFRSYIENAPDGIFVVDEMGRYVDANEAACKMVGYSKDELLTLAIPDLQGTDDSPNGEVSQFKKVKAEETICFETKLKRKDGSKVEVQLDAVRLTNNRLMAFCKDITERKQSEISLRESDKKALALLNASTDVAMLLNPDGTIVAANESAARSFGILQKELVGKSSFEFATPEVAERRKMVFQKTLKDKEPIRFEDESYGRYFDNSVYPILDSEGNLKLCAVFAKDVTEHKQAEEKLMLERSIFMGGPTLTITWLSKPGWPVTYVSPNVKSILGYEVSEMLEPSFLFSDLIYPNDLDRIREEIETFLAEDHLSYELSYRVRTKSGEYRWFNDFTVPQKNEQGELEVIRGYLLDQTEKKKAEEALRTSEEGLRTTLDSIGDAVIATDTQGKITRMNPVAENLTGWKLDEASGKSLDEVFVIINAQTGDPAVNPVDEVMKTGEIVGLANHTALISKDKTVYQISDSGAPIIDAEGKITGVVLVFRDVSGEYILREQYRDMAFLVESASGPLVMSSLEGVLSYVNPAFLKVWGYDRPDEVIGCSIHEFWMVSERMPEIFDTMKTVGKMFAEVQGRRRDGTLFDVQVSAATVQDENGRPVAMMASSEDITERKQAERELIVAKEFAENLLETANTIVVTLNTNAEITIFNSCAEELTGYKKAEVLGRSWFELFIPERDQDAIPEVFGEALKNMPEVLQHENSITIKSGQERLISWSNNVLRDSSGAINGVLSIGRDITKRKEIEEALRESEEQFRALMEQSPFVIQVFNIDGLMVYVNEAWAELWDITNPEEFVGSYNMLEDQQGIELGYVKMFRKAIAGGASILPEAVYDPVDSRNSGRKRILASRMYPLKDKDGNVVSVVLIHEDITERKQVEEELRESEIQYRNLFNSIGDAMFIHDYKGRILKVNQEACKRYGYSSETFLRMEVKDIDTPTEAKYIEERLARLKKEGVVSFETIHLDYENKHIPIGATAKLVEYQGQEVVLTICHDLTHRKQAEEKLKESRTQLIQAQDIAKIGDFHWDIVSDEVTWSDGMYHLLKYRKEEAIDFDKINADIHHPDDLDRVGKWLMESIASGEEQLIPNEYRLICKDGEVLHIQTKGRIEYQNGKAIKLFGTCQDITERKLAEEELREAYKELQTANKDLEAFSHTVAHDLKAPLRYISGFSDILISEYSEKMDEKGRSCLQSIADSSTKASHLIDDIMRFSQTSKGEIKKENVSLSKIAESIASRLSQGDLDRGTQFNIDPDLVIEGDAGLFVVVMENLLDNAWKFTGKTEEAIITFGSKKVKGEKTFFVKDNGAGFDLAEADNLFAPFQRLHSDQEFKGTGVGLATVKRIINRHGGKIWAESQPGKGATFYFTSGEPA